MIKIIYAMMSQHKDEDFEDNLVFAPGEYEIMIFQTPTLIEVNGVMEHHPPHTCIVYKPGQRIHYKSAGGELIYDWIRFDCDEPLYTESLIPFGIPILCTNYNGFIVYWQAVANENYWMYHSHEYVMEQLMHIIFHQLHDYAVHTTNNNYRDDFMELRMQIYRHPEYPWTLDYMADIVHVSVRTLQKLYKEFFHISCMNEVITSRIYQSKILLTSSSHTIQEISERCGYNNIEHFCRQFHQQVGSTPSQYRKQAKIPEESQK